MHLDPEIASFLPIRAGAAKLQAVQTDEGEGQKMHIEIEYCGM
jgi:hypothetical protein